MSHRILVVDDDPHIREVICFALAKAGMTTQIAGDGIAALRQFERQMPDLVVLDVGLPEMDGLEVCRELRRKSDVPILFLSARDEEIDRILGLEIGGDDYVTKPFSPRELTSRINVILRRARPLPDPEPATLPMSHGLLLLDPVRRITSFAGSSLDLTLTEFSIVKILLAKPAHVLNRDQLLEGSHAAGSHVSHRTVDSHIRNIRAKFSAAGCADIIETVHGIGFRLGRCGS